MEPSLADIINEVLDQVCREENLTEQELAKSRGVSRVTIWRWRQADVGTAARILIPLVLDKYKSIQTSSR